MVEELGQSADTVCITKDIPKRILMLLKDLGINDSRFLEYLHTIDLTYVYKPVLKGLYSVFYLGKEYCDELLRLADVYEGNVRCGMYDTFVKIHLSGGTIESRRQQMLEAYYNRPYHEFNQNSQLFLDIIEQKPDRTVERYIANYGRVSKARSQCCINMERLKCISEGYNYRFLEKEETLLYACEEYLKLLTPVFDKSREIEEEQDRLEKIESNYLLALEAKDRMEDFLASEYDSLPDYYLSIGLTYADHGKDRNLVKENFPELYKKYMETVNNKRGLMVNAIKAYSVKLKAAIVQSNYKLSLVDLCKIHNIKDTYYFFNSIVPILDKESIKVFKKYYSMNKGRMVNLVPSKVLVGSVSMNGRDISIEERESVINYMETNNLPMVIGIYNDLLRCYTADSLDLTQLFGI